MVDTIIKSVTVQPNPMGSTKTFTVGENDVVMIDDVATTISGCDREIRAIAIWVQPKDSAGYYCSHEFSMETVRAVEKMPKPAGYRD